MVKKVSRETKQNKRYLLVEEATGKKIAVEEGKMRTTDTMIVNAIDRLVNKLDDTGKIISRHGEDIAETITKTKRNENDIIKLDKKIDDEKKAREKKFENHGKEHKSTKRWIVGSSLSILAIIRWENIKALFFLFLAKINS